MRRHLAIAAAAALLASSGLAYGQSRVEGQIVGIDAERQSIRLDTGQEYVVSQADIARLQPGDRVILTFPEPHVAAAPGAEMAPVALPAESGTIEGRVAGIDMDRQMLRLDTGEVFGAPMHELTPLNPGDRVIVNYDTRDGQVVADSVILSGADERTSPGEAPGAAPQTAPGTGGVADPDAAGRAEAEAGQQTE